MTVAHRCVHKDEQKLVFIQENGILARMKIVRAYKNASIHSKIFWILTIGFAILSIVYFVYPYVWFDLHRSGKEYAEND